MSACRVHCGPFVSELNITKEKLSFHILSKRIQIENSVGIPDFTTPYRRWLEGMRMLEGIDTRTEMVMDVDQVGHLRGGTLISLSIHGDFWRQNKRIHNYE